MVLRQDEYEIQDKIDKTKLSKEARKAVAELKKLKSMSQCQLICGCENYLDWLLTIP